jgi:hypothetical protein
MPPHTSNEPTVGKQQDEPGIRNPQSAINVGVGGRNFQFAIFNLQFGLGLGLGLGLGMTVLWKAFLGRYGRQSSTGIGSSSRLPPIHLAT